MRLPALLRPHGRHRATPPPAPEFRLADLVPGTRWLVCDETRCGHMTTRHLPTPAGWTCTGCQTTKGDQ
jgi:hypothetical protein